VIRIVFESPFVFNFLCGQFIQSHFNQNPTIFSFVFTSLKSEKWKLKHKNIHFNIRVYALGYFHSISVYLFKHAKTLRERGLSFFLFILGLGPVWCYNKKKDSKLS